MSEHFVDDALHVSTSGPLGSTNDLFCCDSKTINVIFEWVSQRWLAFVAVLVKIKQSW